MTTTVTEEELQKGFVYCKSPRLLLHTRARARSASSTIYFWSERFLHYVVCALHRFSTSTNVVVYGHILGRDNDTGDDYRMIEGQWRGVTARKPE